MRKCFAPLKGHKAVSIISLALIIAAGVLLSFLHGCNSFDDQPYTGPRGFENDNIGREKSFFLLEDFEDLQEWAVDSAENHAELSLEGSMKTNGSRALRVKYWARGREKCQIRREVDYNFAPVTHLKIDVMNTSNDPEASFGLAFRTKHGDRFFETVPIKLQPGWNTGIVVPLNQKTFKPAYGKDTYRFWQEGRGEIKRIMVQFFEASQPENEAIIDNLRANAPKQAVVRGELPEITSLTQNVFWMNEYEKFEVTVHGTASYTDPFDTTDVNVRMHLITPKGDHLWIPGFLYDFEEEGEEKLPVWKVRYCPREVGRYKFEVFLSTRKGEAIRRDLDFEVFPNGSKGFVKVSPKHPRYFEFSTGEFFYPFGQNICWASDYQYYFRKMNSYEGNFVRIWLCPWNLYLEPTTTPGRYDLDVGKELDQIVGMAEDYGIYIQLVFEYHDMLRATWNKSPYNEANGGPCVVPDDFFRHPEAKRLFRKKIEYIVNRWGYSTSIMAWELFNEVDISEFGHENDVIQWHKEMSSYIEEIDIYDHLITTSTARKDGMDKLWQLPAIDYTQSHFYSPQAVEQVDLNFALKDRFSKPYFVGEFGRGWRPVDDRTDSEGRLLHASLWMQFMTDSAGNAMAWWWDTYIDPFNLYNHYDALGRYMKGFDRRREQLFPIRMRVKLGENHFILVAGLQTRDSIYLWFCNPDLVVNPRIPRAGNLLTQDLTLYFKGMLDGPYRVEYWDTYQGRIFKNQTINCRNGEFSVVLHKTDWDYALKIISDKAGAPEAGFMPPKVQEQKDTTEDNDSDSFPPDNNDSDEEEDW